MNELAKPHTVLVVDDEQKVLRFMEINLKLNKFDVITTTTGKEALNIIKSEKPDIMLLDIVMPEMDGFEVLKQLRSFSQMPVIVFSASISNHDEALQLGANAFLSKPFRMNDMVKRIKALINT